MKILIPLLAVLLCALVAALAFYGGGQADRKSRDVVISAPTGVEAGVVEGAAKPKAEPEQKEEPKADEVKVGEAPKPLEKYGIRFEDAEWDFGSIRDDAEAVSHQFKFRVVGRKAVEITDLKSSCGCTAAKSGKGVYQPGKEGVVEVTYDPKGRRGNDRKTVSVTVKGEKDPIALSVIGFVDAAFEVEPANKHLGDLPINTKPEPFEVAFISRNPEVKVTGVSPIVTKSNPRVEDRRVSVKELRSEVVEIRGEMRRKTVFEVTHWGSGEVGNWHTQVHFTVDPVSQNLPFFWMHGSFHGPLAVSPTIVTFQEPTDKELRNTDVRLSVRKEGEKFEVLSAELSEGLPSGLKVALIPNESEQAGTQKAPYIVRISGKMPAASTTSGTETVQGQVLIKTTHPEQPEVKVPLTLYIKPAVAVGQNR